MPDPQVIKTNEEAIAVIAARGREEGDSFRVRVLRKAQPASPPTHVAVLEEATLEHIATPELWLPKLAGGGPIYQIEVFSPNDPALKIGAALQYRCENEKPRDADPRVLQDSHWKGPKKIIWPDPDDVRKVAEQIPSFPGGGIGTGAANPDSEARYPGNVSHPPPTNDAQYYANRARMDAEERQRQMDRREQEAQHALQMREQQQRHELELERLRTEMKGMFAQQAQAPKMDLPQLITAIGVVVSPILVKVFEGQKSTEALMQEMIKASLAPKPSIDPAVKEIISELKGAFAAQTPAATQGSQMLMAATESMSHMMKITMNAMSAAAEASGGRDAPPNPMVQVIKEGVKAVGSLMDGYKASVLQKAAPGALAPVGYQQPQLPAPAFQQAATGPVQPGQPAPTVPVPVSPPTPVAPQRAEPNGKTWSGDSVFHLENMIKNRDQNLPGVAKFFIDSLETPEMGKALAEVDGSIGELVAKRLGPWAMSDEANAGYLSALMKEVNKQGEAAGIFEAEDDDEEEEDAEAEG